MRALLSLVAAWLLFLPARAAPRPTAPAVAAICRLPPRGQLLRQGWRYQMGDQPQWARPDFDDRAWDTLNPTRPRWELPARLRTGIGWLRLHLRLGDSLRRHQLVLLSGSATGAWELYLNGERVQRHGVLHPDPDRVLPSGARPAVVEVPSTGPAELVVAVRFAYWAPPLPTLSTHRPLFTLRLVSGVQVRQQEAAAAMNDSTFCVVGGLFGLLTLLHLAFFYYNPRQHANRHFAAYTAAVSLGFGGFYLHDCFPPAVPLTLGLAFGAGCYILLGLGSLWAVRALHDLFGFLPGRRYWGLWILCGGLLAAVFFLLTYGSGRLGVALLLAALLLATAEQLRLTGRALRAQRPGAGIIGVGFGLGVLTLLGTLAVEVAGIEFVPWLNSLSVLLVFLPPALGISLFLARAFALDSQLLQVKLGEVERLSARTLAQEQEKQGLLAQQNETLEHQVRQRTGELQRSLTELRTTQTQLIQQEKMASLGQLTAGIAHEIQNPLNFVTNFAEVSTELLAELAEEHARPERDAGLEADLVGDLQQNLSKITQHGRRAADIVTSMLEHSQPHVGERVATDVNGLCAEYLRRAYQGARAKDTHFEATLYTDFGADLPPVTLVGAEVGRVLLNLIDNAFYAVRKRQLTGEAGYEPRVGVRTVRLNQQVQLQVTDNGSGMSAAVQQKIFQPFFTTKPPGEGTGLGLSLSYDIIVQGHGGTLSVESQEGAGTTLCVGLPVQGVVVEPQP